MGPPHLTLKTSPKTKTIATKNKKKKKEKNKKGSKYPKMSFSVISPHFLCPFCFVQKTCLMTTWPKKRTPPKHYKIGSQQTRKTQQQIAATKRPLLDQKPKSEIPVIIVIGLFFSLNNKKHNK